LFQVSDSDVTIAYRYTKFIPFMADTTQKIRKETLERLRNHGKMGESFEQVVSRLLDQLEQMEHENDFRQS
jgi:hypothetical protein